ncbi:unnamed protein product [Prorocentrum cordatum]|uniref:Uncharacterized protein n=1 Tax=Prorocentrum cordatum TaxID=2364126 RepID=A0ABN9WRT3_9DINO|nr:unnamed protein product [Polarella glacialis]
MALQSRGKRAEEEEEEEAEAEEEEEEEEEEERRRRRARPGPQGERSEGRASKRSPGEPQRHDAVAQAPPSRQPGAPSDAAPSRRHARGAAAAATAAAPPPTPEPDGSVAVAAAAPSSRHAPGPPTVPAGPSPRTLAAPSASRGCRVASSRTPLGPPAGFGRSRNTDISTMLANITEYSHTRLSRSGCCHIASPAKCIQKPCTRNC